jgi:hypothetical protein
MPPWPHRLSVSTDARRCQVRIIDGVVPGPFLAEPGRCSRLVYANAVGQPTLSARPVEWRGRYLAPSRKRWWAVESCAAHRFGSNRLLPR